MHDTSSEGSRTKSFDVLSCDSDVEIVAFFPIAIIRLIIFYDQTY